MCRQLVSPGSRADIFFDLRIVISSIFLFYAEIPYFGVSGCFTWNALFAEINKNYNKQLRFCLCSGIV